jgi:hypothetical protein
VVVASTDALVRDAQGSLRLANERYKVGAGTITLPICSTPRLHWRGRRQLVSEHSGTTRLRGLC